MNRPSGESERAQTDPPAQARFRQPPRGRLGQRPPRLALGLLLLATLALALVLAVPLLACGLWLPNRLLADGGAALLDAPSADFVREIAVMKLARSRHRAILATNTYLAEAGGTELAELRAALRKSGRAGPEIEQIVAAHAAERAALEAAVTSAQALSAWLVTPNLRNRKPIRPAGAVRVVDGLPGEFADYFGGAIAWHAGATNRAKAAWERLLNRPGEQRHYRSTGAAFMLGKACWETDPARAVVSFQLTRTLATNGFPDPLGLAAASLGWEARIELRRGRFERAIDLYLEQMETGDPSAALSLQFAAGLALRGQARSLATLARHSRAQRVITAYVIAGGAGDPPVDIDGPLKEPIARLLDKQTWVTAPSNGWHRLESPALLWLQAVEDAGVRDIDSAEKLALAAYQSGNFEHARRWLDRARAQPAARWLKAKLALRDGKLEDAAALLAGLARQFPLATGAVHANAEDAALVGMMAGRDSSPANPDAQPTALFERLRMDWGRTFHDAQHHALGELGALRLARREYTEALDALLCGGPGYCLDAAYIADRVLTIDELKAYVDRVWPAKTTPGAGESEIPDQAITPRDWLAWRLVRARRLAEARPYLKAQDRPVVDAYLTGIDLGRDARRPAAERAAALWHAAQLVMKSQLCVFNSPAETDWRISGGFEMTTNGPPARLKPPSGPTILPVTADEANRVRQTAARDASWYYRYVAIDLAWEAAELMPHQHPETAHVLWQAGSWIKRIDPEAADRFYKALVRRCGRTQLGREADRKRWFPSDEFALGVKPAPR